MKKAMDYYQPYHTVQQWYLHLQTKVTTEGITVNSTKIKHDFPRTVTQLLRCSGRDWEARGAEDEHETADKRQTGESAETNQHHESIHKIIDAAPASIRTSLYENILK